MRKRVIKHFLSTGVVSAPPIDPALIASWVFETDSNFSSVLSENFATTTSNAPSGYYYNGRTYVVFSGLSDDPYIQYFDHTLESWSAPVKVGTNPLADGDAHGQPGLLVDLQGYLHVTWGAHGGEVQYSKSTNAEDISAWTAMTTFTPMPDGGTYPQMIQFSNGTIYVFYRITGGWYFKTSTDGGENWSAFTKLTGNYAYAIFRKGIGDTIHVSINGDSTTGFARYNVYYLFFDGTNWKNASGTNLSLPVALPTASILVSNTGLHAVPQTIVNYNANNKPYILYSECNDDTEDGSYARQYNYKLAIYGSSWSITDIGLSTDEFRDYATAIDIIGDRVDLYLITGGTAGAIGGNVELWTSYNRGVSFAKIKEITTGQMVEPILVRDYNSDARIFIAEYKATGGFTSRGYLWGFNGYIKNPYIVSALVDTSTPTKVNITFNTTFDESYVPATTDFTITGKTITGVSVVGTLVQLTVSVGYAYGDTSSLSYVKPASNYLRVNVGMGTVASFAGQAITVSEPAWVTVIKKQTTPGTDDSFNWFDFKSGVTADGSNHVTNWDNLMGVALKDLSIVIGTPHLEADGVLFDGIGDAMYDNGSTLAQPTEVWFVGKLITWSSGGRLFDGATTDKGTILQYDATPKLTPYAGGALTINNSELGLDTWGIIRVLYNGASSEYQVNNGTIYTANIGTGAMNGFTLGRRGASTYYSNIKVKGINVRRVPCSAGDRTTLYNGLKSYYGI